MKTQIRKFLQEEDGVTALEYGILAAVVAAVLIGYFSGKLHDIFKSIFTTITNEIPTA